jgi:DNA polymerase III delta subunit
MARVKTERPATPSAWAQDTLPRVVLIAGAESALREDAFKAVRKAAFGAEDPGLGWVTYYGPQARNDGTTVSVEEILTDACTGNLFAAPGEMKVVAVRQADLLLQTKEPREAFENSLGKIPDSCTLILECVQPGLLRNTRLYKTLSAAGAAIDCDPLSGKYGESPELGIEVEKRAEALGLQFDHSALAALLGRCAKNLAVIGTELQKLALELQATPQQPAQVTEHLVLELCSATGGYKPFDFAEAVCERDVKRALETLHGLFALGIQDEKKPGKAVTNESSIAMIVLGALSFKLAQLQDVRAGLDAGVPERQAFQAAKLFYKAEEAARRVLKKHTTASLRRCMEALFRAYMDIRLSGLTPPEVLEKMAWSMVRA